MTGYGLQIADNGIDPLGWKIFVDIIDDYGVIKTKKIHVVEHQKWNQTKHKKRLLKTFKLDKAYTIKNIKLQIRNTND